MVFLWLQTPFFCVVKEFSVRQLARRLAFGWALVFRAPGGYGPQWSPVAEGLPHPPPGRSDQRRPGPAGHDGRAVDGVAEVRSAHTTTSSEREAAWPRLSPANVIILGSPFVIFLTQAKLMREIAGGISMFA